MPSARMNPSPTIENGHTTLMCAALAGDTAEHVRAAWSYIKHKDNAAKYDKDEVKKIKDRIKRAAKEKGVEISEE